MRLVLDASAAIHVVMGTPEAPRLVERLETASLVLAPSLFHAEVANALWKYLPARKLDRNELFERYEEAIGLLDAVEPDASLATEALAAAAHHAHPVYDLLYLVTALRHGCRLLTVDSRLAALARKVDPDLLA
ncbi:type II toxin-antitoxin system VapC family toxin [Burkholderiaceae bacterium FT117]|uniref:type II toxin-antitoxin system VapC family toxin n=1 Tax=Zeimonas sediminis TaxID=2944268 RepID=UPI00234307CE|nr:type II toxin-antitoxin system VapC family toxin [Zeimonas sediminis]MCM5569950.1 type II toxin-antitoxin system VapC family toxin [Zeimonas sediminis]